MGLGETTVGRERGQVGTEKRGTRRLQRRGQGQTRRQDGDDDDDGLQDEEDDREDPRVRRYDDQRPATDSDRQSQEDGGGERYKDVGVGLDDKFEDRGAGWTTCLRMGGWAGQQEVGRTLLLASQSQACGGPRLQHISAEHRFSSFLITDPCSR